MLKHSPHCRTRTAARSPRQSGIVRFGAGRLMSGLAPVFKDNADPDRKMEEYTKNVRFAGAGETWAHHGTFYPAQDDRRFRTGRVDHACIQSSFMG